MRFKFEEHFFFETLISIKKYSFKTIQFCGPQMDMLNPATD